MALKDDALYSWQGRLLMLDDAGVFKEMSGQPLLDAAGEPLISEDAEPVPVDEANMSLVHRALDVISLFEPDPRVRRAAVGKLGNLWDPALIGVLETAFAKEIRPCGL